MSEAKTSNWANGDANTGLTNALSELEANAVTEKFPTSLQMCAKTLATLKEQCSCCRENPKPFNFDPSVSILVSNPVSKSARVDSLVRHVLTASNALS